MHITQTITPARAAAEAQGFQPRKVMALVKNDRMAGTVASWKTARNQEELIAAQMSYQQYGRANGQHSFSENLNAISPAAGGGNGLEPSPEPQEFGFGDLLDMINPLHHIPLVGTIYRAMTGDEIRPVSRVIGGGIFGGALGAAGGLINAVIEEETGRDIPQSALAFALNEDSRFVPPRRTAETYTRTAEAANNPEHAIETALADLHSGRAAHQALSFADISTATASPHKAQQAVLAYQTAQKAGASAQPTAQKVAFRAL
jgi:hypothetical protein